MKVQLHCEDVETHCARDPKDAHLFRKEIDGKEIELDYMPAVGETISLFTKRGWVEATVGTRGAGHAFDDSYESVRNEFIGKTWYGIWFSKITIMEHYIREED